MPLVRIAESDLAFEQTGEHDCLLRAALAAGLGFPYECNSGGCGSCKYELLDGQVDVLWAQAPGLSARDRQKGRLLGCQTVARTDLLIKVRTDADYRLPIPARRRAVYVRGRRALTPDISEFRFQSADGAKFLPGQYALLSIPGVSGPRAYSMSNLANDEGLWEFCIRRVPGGAATGALFGDLPDGAQVFLDGPYGLAYLQRESQLDVVCIAGGSGISPMLSIARAVITDPAMAERRVYFFFGGRSPVDLCGETELCVLPGYGERLTYHCAISDPDSAADWSGERGFIHEVVQRQLGGRLASMECYLAGPPPMVQAAQRMLLLDEGVPAGRVHFDRFF